MNKLKEKLKAGIVSPGRAKCRAFFLTPKTARAAHRRAAISVFPAGDAAGARRHDHISGFRAGHRGHAAADQGFVGHGKIYDLLCDNVVRIL